jgi:hypothetical protein
MCSHNTKEHISHYMNGIIIENPKFAIVLEKKFIPQPSFQDNSVSTLKDESVSIRINKTYRVSIP